MHTTMKTHYRIAYFAALALMMCLGCSKDNDESAGPDATDKKPREISAQSMTDNLNLERAALDKFNEFLGEATDVSQAIFYMGVWLSQQDLVKQIAYTNNNIVHIAFTDGMESNIVFMPEDANGKPVYRGAPNNAGPAATGDAAPLLVAHSRAQNAAAKEDEIVIENKNVLLFNPEADEFYYNNYYKPIDILNNAIKDLSVTVLNNDAARLDKIDEFYKYGLIVINTHGIPGAFSIKSGFEQRDYKTTFDPYELDSNILAITKKRPEDFKTGKLTIDLHTRFLMPAKDVKFDVIKRVVIKIGVTENYIRDLKPLDNAVVFANFCYSGHTVEGATTRNMVEAFAAINAKTYYGWANGLGEGEPVINDGAQLAEERVLKNLAGEGLVTGESHLLPDGEIMTVSYAQMPKFDSGVSVFTVLPNETGEIDYSASYQKVWVAHKKPEKNDWAVELHHHLNPNYTYDDTCDLQLKNGLTAKECDAYFIAFAKEVKMGELEGTLLCGGGTLFTPGQPTFLAQFAPVDNAVGYLGRILRKDGTYGDSFQMTSLEETPDGLLEYRLGVGGIRILQTCNEAEAEAERLKRLEYLDTVGHLGVEITPLFQ